MVKYSYGGPLILALAMQMMLSINVCASEPSKPGGSCESKQFGEGGPSVKVCKDSMRCAVVGKKEQCLTVYAHKPEESPFADILDLSRTNFPCAVARGKRDEHPVKPGFWGAPNFSTYTDCGSGKWVSSRSGLRSGIRSSKRPPHTPAACRCTVLLCQQSG